jgi:hypothetical protein
VEKVEVKIQAVCFQESVRSFERQKQSPEGGQVKLSWLQSSTTPPQSLNNNTTCTTNSELYDHFHKALSRLVLGGSSFRFDILSNQAVLQPRDAAYHTTLATCLSNNPFYPGQLLAMHECERDLVECKIYKAI